MQGFSSRHLKRLAARERNDILKQRNCFDSDEYETSEDSCDTKTSNPLGIASMNDEYDYIETQREDVTLLQLKLRNWYLKYKPPKDCVEDLLKILKSENIDVPITIKELLKIGSTVKQLVVKSDQLNIDQRLQNIETNQKKIIQNQSKLKRIVLQMQEESLHLQSQILAILNQTVKKNNKTILVQHVEFPITTLEQLKSIDEKIKKDMEAYIQKLKLIISPEGLRRNIHRIISKDVLLKCNYDGGYNNTSLKTFQGLTTAMYEAVKEEGYSEVDFVKDLRMCVRCVKGRHYKDLCVKRKKLSNNYIIP